MDLGVILFIASNVSLCLNVFTFDSDMSLNTNHIIFALKVKLPRA